MRVLGIDPGTSVTGWAVLEAATPTPERVASGSAKLSSDSPLSNRLGRIHDLVRELILRYEPGALSLEKAFVARNVQSALRLGEARGAVLVAAASCGLSVFEYSPAEVKVAIVGYGRADKAQILRGVALVLGLSDVDRADEADALAAAFCHLRGARIRSLASSPRGGRPVRGVRRAR
jgi:crossover junction endodeoxyribonuclease RuvC